MSGCCSKEDTGTFWQGVNEKDEKKIQKTVLNCCFRGPIFWKIIAVASVDGITGLENHFKPASHIPAEIVSMGWNIFCILDLIVGYDQVTKYVTDSATLLSILKDFAQ